MFVCFGLGKNYTILGTQTRDITESKMNLGEWLHHPCFCGRMYN